MDPPEKALLFRYPTVIRLPATSIIAGHIFHVPRLVVSKFSVGVLGCRKTHSRLTKTTANQQGPIQKGIFAVVIESVDS